MRFLDEQAIEDIAVGASLLGTGGGGDPYIGKLMALNAIKKYGSVKLLSADECPEDAIVLPAAVMGAPSVLIEKIPNGDEFVRVFSHLEKYLNKKIYATFPIEAGGLNSMIPIVVASQLGIPLIDCDLMGRAFPELQMVTFHLNDISSTPMAIADEKGNIAIIETVNNKWTEKFARSLTIEMGASASISLYPATGKQLRQYGIKGIITLSEKIGRIIRQAAQYQSSLELLIEQTEGYHLFSGKIIDVTRKIKNAFNFGTVTIEGIDSFKDKTMCVEFQNENLLATIDETPVAVTPDLISLINLETLIPLTTESLKYGKRVHVIGLKADAQWRTSRGLKTAGPRYFGYEVDYIPIENLFLKRI